MMDIDEEEVYEWKKIKDEIICSICAGFFTDPKTIRPCLHTFCKVCLRKRIEMEKSLKMVACCPLCRAKLTQDDVNLLPTNYVSKRLVHIYHDQQGRRNSTLQLTTKVASADAISGDVGCADGQSTDSLMCSAKCSYSPKREDELELKEGDRLYVINSKDPNRWLVQNKNSTLVGYVPSQYVSKNISLVQNPQHDQADIERSRLHYPMYTAKYSYSPRRKTELAFKKGDKLYIMNTDDPGWWVGKNEDMLGQVGYIPSNYVVPESQLEEEEEPRKKLGIGFNNYQKCIANYSYSPTQENYLSFNKGEMLYVINNNVDGDFNWWLAGKMGSIPSSCISEYQLQNKSAEDDIEKKLEALKACDFNHPLVIAKCDYSPRKDSELGFKEGDLLHVMNRDDPNWWLAGQIGCVPSNYVSLVNDDTDQSKVYDSTLSYPLYIAKCDYSARTKDDLNFKKGDLLYIIDNDDDGWWLAKKKDSSQQGYIPSSYVKEFKSLLDVEEWYFGAISETNAEELLLLPPNDSGSFLIHDSANTSSGYSYVLRHGITIMKWKINKSSDGKYFFNSAIMFDSLSKLIAHHSEHIDYHTKTMVQRTPCVPSEVHRTAGLSKETNKAWKIQRSSLKLCVKIDTGNFGEVWEAMWNNTTPVIVNTLNSGTIDFLKEATVMKQLRHRNVVQLYAVCVEEGPIYEVMEPTKHGNLRDFLRRNGRNLRPTQLINMGAQVAAGMAYLEKNSYVHGNLAAKSVFVSEHLICRIGQLGIISTYSKEAREEFIRSNARWFAPEVLNKFPSTTKSDVWSFGILLYEVVTYGRIPYPGISNCQLLETLQAGYRMHCPTGCPDQLHKIMMKCWHKDADSRPTFETLQWQLEQFFVDNVLYSSTVATPCLAQSNVSKNKIRYEVISLI